MITLFGYDTVNTLKVLIMLEEIRAEYTIKTINIHEGDQHSDDFLAINPKAKIPVIIDTSASGSVVKMAESVAILIYLAEKSGSFLPTAREDNARALEWLLYQASAMGPIFGQCEYWYRLAGEPNPKVLSHYQTLAQDILAHIDRHLSENTYFAGDAYSIADISHFAWLCRCHTAGLTLQSFDNLKKWYQEVSLRPAITRSIEIVTSQSRKAGQPNIPKTPMTNTLSQANTGEMKC